MARISSLLAGVLASCLLTASVQAQPGPLTATNSSPAAPQVQAPSSVGLTADTMATALRKNNAQVDIVKNQNGQQNLAIKMEHNGWKFDVEIEFTNNGRSFYLTIPLGYGNKLTPAQMVRLLEVTHEKAPAYFALRKKDNRLVFEDFYGASMSEADFLSTLTRLLGTVQSTQAAWDSTRWTN